MKNHWDVSLSLSTHVELTRDFWYQLTHLVVLFLAPFILPWRQLKKEEKNNSSGIKSVLVCVQETATFQLFGVWCHANCLLDSFIGLQMITWLISSQSEPSDNNNDNILTIIKTLCCLHFLPLFLPSSEETVKNFKLFWPAQLRYHIQHEDFECCVFTWRIDNSMFFCFFFQNRPSPITEFKGWFS